MADIINKKEIKMIYRKAYFYSWIFMLMIYLVVTGIFYLINLFFKVDANIWFISLIGTSLYLFHKLAEKFSDLTVIYMVLEEQEKKKGK